MFLVNLNTLTFSKQSGQSSGKNLAFEKGKGYNGSYSQTGNRAAREETPPGCKRESIMRICVEKKGIVPRCIFQNSWVAQGWNNTNHFLKLEWSN